MTTVATSNYGSTWTFNGAVVGPCVVQDFPEISTGKIETTNHAGGGVSEFIPSGVVTLGEITMSVIAQAGILTTLKAALANKTIAPNIIGNAVETFTFNGFIMSVKPESADATSPDANKYTVVVAATGALT